MTHIAETVQSAAKIRRPWVAADSSGLRQIWKKNVHHLDDYTFQHFL